MSYKNRKAVALEYGENPAPILTAKGDGKMAQAIIEEGRAPRCLYCRGRKFGHAVK